VQATASSTSRPSSPSFLTRPPTPTPSGVACSSPSSASTR
jgi:hypothetical protein